MKNQEYLYGSDDALEGLYKSSYIGVLEYKIELLNINLTKELNKNT